MFEFKKYLYFIFFLGLSLATISCLLNPGYVLTLDMVFGPSPKILDVYGLSDPPVFGGGLWLSFLTKLCSPIVPTWIIQKVFLFLIFFLSGFSAHSLIETKSSVARYFAGTLYMVNPFVYTRFLAGHWALLLAYAVTPFAFKYFFKFLDNPSKQNFVKTLISLLFVSVSSHILALTILAFFVVFCFKSIELRSEVKMLLPKLALFALAFLAVNAYWLIPLTTAKETLVQQISERDLLIFAPRGEGLSIPYTLASMYGFWRNGYIYTKDIFPAWHLFFILILLLAISGFISTYKDRKTQSIAAIGLISFLLAWGALGPLKPLFESLSILRAFRDSQKFVGALVLTYAYLGALGVEDLQRSLKRKKLTCTIIIGFVLLTPLAYNFTQFGFWGQLQPTDYPPDWYKANEFLNADKQDFNVLFLPWHQYMDFGFVPNRDKRILNPAPIFFDKPVISGQNLELPGIYTQSTNPGQRYVENLLSSGAISGANLRLLNVKYVILAKEADYTRYLEMLNRSDLELVFESDNIMIYRNPLQVSRFYAVDTLSLAALEPLTYRTISPVEFEVTNNSRKYTIFVPPNFDSRGWLLNGKEAAPNFYAAWEVDGTHVYYGRFTIYKISYIISSIAAVAVVAFYIISRKNRVENS
jgi:hypothetical protein